jgi:hypothetical protein
LWGRGLDAGQPPHDVVSDAKSAGRHHCGSAASMHDGCRCCLPCLGRAQGATVIYVHTMDLICVYVMDLRTLVILADEFLDLLHLDSDCCFPLSSL